MHPIALEIGALLFAGLLAGEEFVICFGVRKPLASLEDLPHIQLRQALIRKLRILVPSLFAPALLFGIGALFLDHGGPGFSIRCAGVAGLLVFISFTLFGTVPINEGALAWDPHNPPNDWKGIIARWERLDVVRCWAAVLGFACFLVAIGLRLAG